MSQRWNLLQSAVLSLSGIMAAGSVSAQTPQSIHVGWTVPAEEAKWLIMKRPELFPDYGKAYTIEWSQFQGTPPMSQALMAGALDCATQAPASFGQAAAAGNFQGYILGSLAQERSDHFSVFWATKKGSPIKSAADLKGKTVASTVFGGGIYYYMLIWLKEHGIDPEKDIRLTEIGFPMIEDALKAGRVDLGPFAQPFASRAEEHDDITKLFSISEVQSPLTDTFEACRKAFVDAHPAAIKAYMNDFKAATRYAYAHPDEARKVTSEITKIDFATLQKYLLTDKDFYRDPNGTPDFASIQKTFDLFYKNGYLPTHIDVKNYQRLDLTPAAN
jgi:NitT/TauT family transport system substrate-binding protein/sulfonate transport system substrate-binding protein